MPIWVWWPMLLVGLVLLYVFVVQGEYVRWEIAEGQTCDEWRAELREIPSECDEGLIQSIIDILTGDASIAP